MNGPVAGSAIEIARGGNRVLVVPGIGGAIARWRLGDVDILRPAPDEALREGHVRRMGSFPLVPYSNRVAGARLLFGGQEYALRPNFPPEPHAIHGVGWQRAWRSGSRTDASIQLELTHAPDDDWPFRFAARQALSVTADALEVRLGVRNADARAMPAGLGFHPFFPLVPSLRLQAEWDGTWKADAQKLPQRWTAVAPESDFRVPRPVAQWRVDQCFSGWKRRARLVYPAHQVDITASEDLSFLACFVPGDGRDFIALEPVSHANNAFALAAQGHGRTGMRILAPGEEWEVSMTIAVGAPAP